MSAILPRSQCIKIVTYETRNSIVALGTLVGDVLEVGSVFFFKE